jgi:WD40 repeat protein
VAWPGEGRVIVASTDAGALFTYKNLKAHTGRESSESGEERKLGEAGDTVQCIAFSSDAKKVFAGTHDGVVHVWSSDGKLLAKLEPSTNTPTFPLAAQSNDRGNRREEALLKRGTRSAERGTENNGASSRRLLQGGNVV